LEILEIYVKKMNERLEVEDEENVEESEEVEMV
jgi:hypothetical protein